MDAGALQRFALLLMLFGGVLELSAAVQESWGGLFDLGIPIMFLALFVGTFGTVLGLR
ncbi:MULTISPECIES: hypothetical protein [Halorussus]|uniref:hypothetical protein n=1 Tax=Halorussus TaxID=1070314 RepID=UPI0020A1B987|nr:hypothetical protein [Halorussus vallis]USZ76872.1 hypothetical protein NGM07_05970 [Halorussus vallis]